MKRSRFTTYLCPPAERGDERQSRIQNAKEVCRTCSVIEQCLAHALRIPEPYGIWGGLRMTNAQRLGVQSPEIPRPRKPHDYLPAHPRSETRAKGNDLTHVPHLVKTPPPGAI